MKIDQLSIETSRASKKLAERNLMNHHNEHLFRYWGKADPAYLCEPKWHPLVYHCLDVATVAAAWWDTSSVIRRISLAALDWPEQRANQLRALVLFFIALHDLGKFDVRFQLKALEALRVVWPKLSLDDVDESFARNFDHGSAGYALAMREIDDWAGESMVGHRDRWRPWVAAVTGHHGDIPSGTDSGEEYTEQHVMEHDRMIRHAFVSELAGLFLAPEGLGLQDLPPACLSSSSMAGRLLCRV